MSQGELFSIESDDRPLSRRDFPCQPFSIAGKREGASDERNLWPDTERILRELKELGKPVRWFLGENVRGLLSMRTRSPYPRRIRRARGIPRVGTVFGDILRDLAGLGYRVCWACYGADESAGAPHLRDRIFVVAYYVADGAGERREGFGLPELEGRSRTEGGDAHGRGASLADSDGNDGIATRSRSESGRDDGRRVPSGRSGTLGYSERSRRREDEPGERSEGRASSRRSSEELGDAGGLGRQRNARRRARAKPSDGCSGMADASGEPNGNPIERASERSSRGSSELGDASSGRFGVGGRADQPRDRGYANVSDETVRELGDADGSGFSEQRGPVSARTELGAAECRGGNVADSGSPFIRSEPYTGTEGRVSEAGRLEGSGSKQLRGSRDRLRLESGREHVPARNDLEGWRELLRERPELSPAVTRSSEVELGIRESVNGLSRRMALRALGNAVDPWQALPIFEEIAAFEGIQ